MSEGHPRARKYVLGRLMNEASLCERRLNNKAASDAVVMQAVIGSIMSKEGGEHLNKVIARLRDG